MDGITRPPVAVVTGGAGGIGLATCAEFLSRGYSVAVLDCNEDGVASAADSLRDSDNSVMAVIADVTDSIAVDAAMASVVHSFGGIDVLINCAGTADRAPAAEITDQSWSRLIDIHLSGTFRCCRSAFQALCDSSAGSIVNMSSVAAHTGFPLRASYCAAKSGIESLTRSLAVEWAPHGIRVNAVAPTWVRTAILKEAVASGALDEDTIEAITPLGGVVEPADVAKVIAFLSSADARMITGQSLLVDGAFVINPHI